MGLKRRLLVVLAMAPLAVAVAWGRSHIRPTLQLAPPVMVGQWYASSQPTGFGLQSIDGVLEVWHSKCGNASYPASKLERFRLMGLKMISEDSLYTATPNGPLLCSHTDALAVPYWLLQLASLVPVGLGWRRSASVIPSGHCKKCGYDLRATPSRCPECGLVPAASC
jgi:hypothetical protein